MKLAALALVVPLLAAPGAPSDAATGGPGALSHFDLARSAWRSEADQTRGDTGAAKNAASGSTSRGRARLTAS
jgi:hypothetical protein